MCGHTKAISTSGFFAIWQYSCLWVEVQQLSGCGKAKAEQYRHLRGLLSQNSLPYILAQQHTPQLGFR